jgi:hypothetical protein
MTIAVSQYSETVDKLSFVVTERKFNIISHVTFLGVTLTLCNSVNPHPSNETSVASCEIQLEL